MWPTVPSTSSRSSRYCSTRSRLGLATWISVASPTDELAVRQEFLEGLEPVPDALGVIQPVHAQQDGFGVAQVLADLPGPLDDVRLGGKFGDLLNVDGDGEGLRTGDVGDLAVVALDVHLLLLDAGAKEPPGGAHEVAGVAGPLEAHQVGAQQAVDDGLPPGQLGEDLRRREGDVVEEPDPEVRPGLAQHAAEPAAAGSPGPRRWRRGRRGVRRRRRTFG